MPVPVDPPAPDMIAVYAPGGSVTSIADSNAFEGAKPLAWICEAFAALPQLSLVATTDWSDVRTSVIVGLARGLAIPYAASEGPVPTMATVLASVPWITKPPIITSLPV